MQKSIEHRAAFDLVRYANCWEDADVLCAALQPGPGKRILSIASAGDNSLALAAEGAEVVAADLSLPQLACVELRKAALRELEYDDVLAFFGVRPSDARLATYEKLRPALTAPTRACWDERRGDILSGFVHRGKFESYFRKFRTLVLPCIHRRKIVMRLLAEKDEVARREFYEKVWNNVRWRLLFRVFFSRFTMGRLGRDPEFFRYVEGSVAERILSRTKYALTVLPIHANPYVQYILTGNYQTALPRYLRPEKFESVRAGLDRVTVFHGPVQEAARQFGEGGFDGFNLSDIFEYLSPELCREIYQALLDRARPGARLAYWNMLVPRRCPSELAVRVRYEKELSEDLFQKDLAFFYSALVVETCR
ncbi:MAG: DUF3419 family protein [Planctomycetia bacterium]|nr:DUF3419 family protein [Planctomycetia bacterium]